MLNEHAISKPAEMKKLAGTSLEQCVKDIMAYEATGTAFENTIECLGGISFPDIIANNYYGVEVKTTVKNHWKTTGNSVLETTRREDIEKIFLLFGKLGDPVEFRCRAYEECLSEVVVTHSPRYLIDMNLASDKTIFDKIKIPYNELRKETNPIKSIVKYYKSLLKPGEELWWIDPSNPEPVNMVIRLWNNLTIAEKNSYIIKSLVYFPELIGKSSSKFNRVSIWLSTSQGIVCPNVRDLYTAGGRTDLVIENKLYKNVPRIFQKIYEKRKDIYVALQDSDNEELAQYWGLGKIDDRFEAWLKIATHFSLEILPTEQRNLITDMFSA